MSQPPAIPRMPADVLTPEADVAAFELAPYATAVAQARPSDVAVASVAAPIHSPWRWEETTWPGGSPTFKIYDQRDRQIAEIRGRDSAKTVRRAELMTLSPLLENQVVCLLRAIYAYRDDEDGALETLIKECEGAESLLEALR